MSVVLVDDFEAAPILWKVEDVRRPNVEPKGVNLHFSLNQKVRYKGVAGNVFKLDKGIYLKERREVEIFLNLSG